MSAFLSSFRVDQWIDYSLIVTSLGLWVGAVFSLLLLIVWMKNVE